MRIAVIVLAAGGSTRLGSPKQLLAYRGSTLLRHAAEIALATVCRPVVIVLGAGADRLRHELTGLDVQIVDNPDWGNGMGTSIRRGVAALQAMVPDLDGALLMLCDQPLVTSEGLASLVRAFEGGQETCRGAAAAYEGTVGVPALFGRELLAAVDTLPDGAGAKALLRQLGAEIVAVPLPEAAMDVDTRADFERLPAG